MLPLASFFGQRVPFLGSWPQRMECPLPCRRAGCGVDCLMQTTALRARCVGCTSSDFTSDLRQNGSDVVYDLTP
jgi:hypothetical protein